MADSPAFAATVNNAAALISAANTNLDGASGTRVTVFTAGVNGSRIDTIKIQAVVTTTAGMVRLWLHNGTTAFLFDEVVVAAITVGASTEAFSAVLTYSGATLLVLKSGWTLQASTHNAESFHVHVFGGDF